jgi:hypothetical protein
MTRLCAALALWLALAAAAAPALAQRPVCQGQTLYVPVVSYLYLGKKGAPYPLDMTLHVRNTDASRPIELTGASYYDGSGRLVRNYLVDPVQLAPRASLALPLAQPEPSSPGEGPPSVVVTWSAGQPASAPVAQCVHVGSAGQQGISFVTNGRVLSQPRP